MTLETYPDKVLGCWLGKNIGGTIGAPFEWRRQVNEVSFYTQDLKGEPLANDDLDIQLLWLIALEEKGISIDARTLADYWCLYVTPHWAEYGTGKINMRSGLQPLSGSVSNIYKDSCGAFIRSEIWACIAPGHPKVAVRYALEDAILDHGNGEGTYAEVFTAALESAAFVVSDIGELIEIGLSYIPADCGIGQAVRTTLECRRNGKSWLETRDEILRRHRGSSAMNDPQYTSPRDRALGFAEGKQGYDAPSNIAMTVLGLLYGGEDFGKVMTTTVNCGEDTDCTAATAGSIYGILHGASAVPARWIEPIGRSIKTACLNLGELGYFGNQLPRDVDELSRRTERIARQVLLRGGADFEVEGAGTPPGKAAPAAASAKPEPSSLRSSDRGKSLYHGLNGGRYDFDFFTISVDYGEGPFIKDGVGKMLRFTVHNTYKVQANLSLHWYLPEGWVVKPSADGYAMSLPTALGSPVRLDYELTCARVMRTMNRAALEISIEGRPTTMLVPVTLLNANAPAVRGE